MKVAFASCCHATDSGKSYQPIWGIIQKQEPDLLVLLGDNVYLGHDGYKENDLRQKMKMLKEKYKNQFAERHFRKLLDEVPFLVVWDNHDFGLPGEKFREEDPDADIYGAGVSQDFRDASTELFNKYFKSRARSIVPPSNKVYCSHIFGTGSRKIKFIMLDVRSRQEDPTRNTLPKLIDDDQKVWLRNEILLKEAEINVICSGMTFTADNNEDEIKGWQQYASWFKEFKLIAAKTSKPLFLGGNIHRNAFIRHSIGPEGDSKYMYELVSSGVGHNFTINGNDPPPDDDDGFNEATGIDEISLDRIRSNGIGSNTLSKLPCNNYGIIDFTDTLVKATLYSQKPGNNYYAEINRDDWTLKKKWRMGHYNYNY